MERFKRRLRVILAEQYDNVGEIADKTLKEKCIVIVDDWNLVRLNRSHSTDFLAALRDAYQGVVLTVPSGYELQWLESVRDGPRRSSRSGASKSPTLATASDMNLSSGGSSDILNNCTDVELHRELVEARRKIVNRVLGSNLVPRTPFMVLILLQAIDAGKESDLTRTGYIRYYKFLIDNTILRNVSSRDAEGAYALLPELAWGLYSTGAKVLSAGSAEKIIEQFAERKALSKGFLYSVLGSLRTIGMFDTVNDTHRFRHAYAYYFFLAEYVSARMNTPEMQALVMKLCREVSIKETATLLVFLSYHPETTTLITETLLSGLTTLYSKATPFEFSTDRAATVNMLVYELPNMIFDADKKQSNVAFSGSTRTSTSKVKRPAMRRREANQPLQ